MTDLSQLLSLFIFSAFCCRGLTLQVSSHLPREISKRDVTAECYIPEALSHGRFKNHPRRCPDTDLVVSDACRLVPGSPVEDRWLLYYTCDEGYELSGYSRASLCVEGKWRPVLPSCVPALNLVTREGWGAPANSSFPSHKLPVTRVIIEHTATGSCDDKADCVILLQSIHENHKQRYGDIGYNFLVGGDGSVYEGQGWDKIGAHTYGYNTRSIGVALLGNFVDHEAPQNMLESTKKLIEYGLGTGKVAADYKLNGHCQLIQVASPGKRVFDVIKRWPHWDSVNALRCTQ